MLLGFIFLIHVFRLLQIGDSNEGSDYRLVHVAEDVTEDGYYEYPSSENNQETCSVIIKIFTKLKFRNVPSNLRKLWHNGNVPFIISRNCNRRLSKIILGAIKRYRSETCVSFIPRKYEATFIKIAPANRRLILGSEGNLKKRIDEPCYKQDIILYELMKVLGAVEKSNRLGEVKNNTLLRNPHRYRRKSYMKKLFSKVNFLYGCNKEESTISRDRISGRPLERSIRTNGSIREKRSARIPRTYRDPKKYFYTTSTKATEITTENNIVTTLNPEITTENNIVTTLNPEITTESNFTTLNPEVTTRSNITTLDPKITTESNVTTTIDPKVTTESNITTTLDPNITTENNITTSDSNITTESNITTTSDPNITTESNITTALDPNITTESDITTSEPHITTESNITTTLNTEITTESTITTTLRPGTTTQSTVTNLYPKTTSERKATYSYPKPTYEKKLKYFYSKTTNGRKLTTLSPETTVESKLTTEKPRKISNDFSYHYIEIVSGINLRTVITDPSKLWSSPVIPFLISEKYDEIQQKLIKEGMQDFHNQTCVKFIPRTTENTYIRFVSPDTRCSATIGTEQGTVNEVSLADGCFAAGTILHEIMHTLGFIHEQTRHDRDKYVTIHWNNIISGFENNFKKFKKDEIRDYGVGYDYGSVMHYGAYDFAEDQSRPTITPLEPGVEIGQRKGFSEKDAFKINKLFNCDDSFITQRKKSKEKADATVKEFAKKFLDFVAKLFKSLYRTLLRFRPNAKDSS